MDAVIPLLIDIKIIMTISKEITAYKLKLKNYNTRYNLGRLYYLHLICYVYLHPQAFYITVLSSYLWNICSWFPSTYAPRTPTPDLYVVTTLNPVHPKIRTRYIVRRLTFCIGWTHLSSSFKWLFGLSHYISYRWYATSIKNKKAFHVRYYHT